MERNDDLIKKKIYKYMITGVMTTIALHLGNVVDAMIVGNLLGSIGNAAVSASTPYTYLLQAATILLGSGGAVIARDEFARVFAEAQNDPAKARTLTSIMAYVQSAGGREIVRLNRTCAYTLQILYRLGFSWPFTTWDYISRFVEALTGLGFFTEEDEF